MMARLFPCPACGFCVFEEPAGSYDICSICGWEDDVVQLRFPALRGGANRSSLWQYQQAILIEFPPEIQRFDRYRRDPQWRPLLADEAGPQQDQPRSRLDYFLAATDDPTPYYWKK